MKRKLRSFYDTVIEVEEFLEEFEEVEIMNYIEDIPEDIEIDDIEDIYRRRSWMRQMDEETTMKMTPKKHEILGRIKEKLKMDRGSSRLL